MCVSVVTNKYGYCLFRLTTTMEITLKLITLVGIVNNIDAYGSGAPVSVCQDMTPQHGVSAQTGAVPYQITVDPSTYMTGSMNTGTIIISVFLFDGV